MYLPNSKNGGSRGINKLKLIAFFTFAEKNFLKSRYIISDAPSKLTKWGMQMNKQVPMTIISAISRKNA